MINWWFDWLADWLVDWSIDRPIDWLVDWWIDWLIDWLTGRPIDWLIGWLGACLIECLIDWLIDWLINWLMPLLKHFDAIAIVSCFFVHLFVSVYCSFPAGRPAGPGSPPGPPRLPRPLLLAASVQLLALVKWVKKMQMLCLSLPRDEESKLVCRTHERKLVRIPAGRGIADSFLGRRLLRTGTESPGALFIRSRRFVRGTSFILAVWSSPSIHAGASQRRFQPLLSLLLGSVVDCRKFVERGCLGYTVSSLASRDDHVRRAGYHVMSRYLHHLEGARFREKKQVSQTIKRRPFRWAVTASRIREAAVRPRMPRTLTTIMLCDTWLHDDTFCPSSFAHERSLLFVIL